MLYILTLMNLLYLQVAHAEDHAPFALKQAELLLVEANKLITSGDVTEELFASNKPKQSCSSFLFTSHPKPRGIPSGNKILVFVSFSMPEASLKSLVEEAPKHNAVLVMRGLYEDSFVKTAQKLKDLNLTIDIHPDLFESHKITSVPTFIELKDNKPVKQLSGNVSLSFCLSKFKEQS